MERTETCLKKCGDREDFWAKAAGRWFKKSNVNKKAAVARQTLREKEGDKLGPVDGSVVAPGRSLINEEFQESFDWEGSVEENWEPVAVDVVDETESMDWLPMEEYEQSWRLRVVMCPGLQEGHRKQVQSEVAASARLWERRIS